MPSEILSGGTPRERTNRRQSSIQGYPATGPTVDPPVWVDNVRRRLLSARAAEFPTPAQKDPPTYVPPRDGSSVITTSPVVGRV